MQQSTGSKSFFAWTSGIFSNVITQQKIIDALRDDIKDGLLSSGANDFIFTIIMPYLKIARNDPEHLAKVLKAALNVIYLQCDPDTNYSMTRHYIDSKDKPSIPHYLNMEVIRANWDKRYKEWFDLAKPFVEDNGLWILSENIDYSSFENCLLSAIPEDGTVFYPNAKILVKLQGLVRQYNVLEDRLVIETPHNRELKVLSPHG